ncbi:MAG: hypothetical protein V1686_01420 [Patescibacteria group bacterium]
MNKRVILIIALLVIVAGISYLIYQSQHNPKQLERACIDSGGTVIMASCCQLTSDFPNSCSIGACGCSPDHSKQVKARDCGDKCWNGIKCVNN